MPERNPNVDAFVQELITIGGFIVMAYLARKMVGPDFGRTLRMKTALTTKRIADAQAEMWSQIAGKAATSYNKARV